VIIESHHQRGADELPHRGFKDFGFEGSFHLRGLVPILPFIIAC
jgi:hypothetical protein